MPSTYEPIATVNGTGSSGTINFTSIAGTYTDLIVICNFTNVSVANVYMTFNSDSGSNYSRTWLTGDGSTASSGRGTVPYLNNNATISSTPASTIINIMNYANTTTYKTSLVRHSLASGEALAEVILYRGSTGSSTGAITSVQIIGTTSFTTTSTFTLYGVKAA
jgi:hypothetical protein